MRSLQEDCGITDPNEQAALMEEFRLAATGVPMDKNTTAKLGWTYNSILLEKL